jgi:sugar transferase (PEP-CTERM system associated)
VPRSCGAAKGASEIMLRIFGHFVPVPALTLGMCEVLLLSCALYLVSAPVDLLHFQLAMIPARFSVGIASMALLAMLAVGLYNHDVFLDSRLMAIKVVTAFLLVAPAVAAVGVISSGQDWGGEGEAWPTWCLKASLVWLASVLITRTVFLKFSSAEMFRRPVIILGTGVRAARIAELLQRGNGHSFTAKAFVHACGDPRLVMGARLDLDRTSDDHALARYAREIGAREIVVATDERRGMPVGQLLHCKIAGINVADYLTFWERETRKVEVEALQPSWLVYSDGFRQGALVDAAKRVFDVMVSLTLLILVLPLCIFTMIAIRIEGGGPLLYGQERVGRDGKVFRLVKFRSMQNDAERDGAPRWAINRDPRVTRVGGVMRKFRIDELPQFWNVLKGDMSFVGPRPERPFFVEELAKSIPFYRERHSVKPGISGWAQVNYPYGASLEDARQKLAYDLYYVKNRTLFLDFVVLIQTVRVILFQEGAR